MDEEGAIKLLIAIHMVRSISHLRSFNERWPAIAQRAVEDSVRDPMVLTAFREAEAREPSEGELEKAAWAIEQGIRDSNRIFVQQQLDQFHTVVERVATWDVWLSEVDAAAGVQLVTSDAPVVAVGEAGVVDTLAMPVTVSLLAGVGERTHPATIGREGVVNVNRVVAREAHRWVIAHPDSNLSDCLPRLGLVADSAPD